MARSAHRLHIKSGFRTVANEVVNVDPKDDRDIEDAARDLLDAKRQGHITKAKVTVFKGNRWVKEVRLR